MSAEMKGTASTLSPQTSNTTVDEKSNERPNNNINQKTQETKENQDNKKHERKKKERAPRYYNPLHPEHIDIFGRDLLNKELIFSLVNGESIKGKMTGFGQYDENANGWGRRFYKGGEKKESNRDEERRAK